MATTDMAATEQAMDDFYDAAARLVSETTLRGVLLEYSQCIRHLERIPADLRAEFELDQFLLSIGLERTVNLLAA